MIWKEGNNNVTNLIKNTTCIKLGIKALDKDEDSIQYLR